MNDCIFYIDPKASARVPKMLMMTPCIDEYSYANCLKDYGINAVQTNNSLETFIQNLTSHCDISFDNKEIDFKKLNKTYRAIKVDPNILIKNKQLQLGTIYEDENKCKCYAIAAPIFELLKYESNFNPSPDRDGLICISIDVFLKVNYSFNYELTGKTLNTYNTMKFLYAKSYKDNTLNFASWTTITPIEKKMNDRDVVVNYLSSIFKRCYNQNLKILFTHETIKEPTSVGLF